MVCPDSSGYEFQVFEEAMQICTRAQFPLIFAQDCAKLFYNFPHLPRLQEEKRALMGLCFFKVALDHNCPRTLREIAAMQWVPLKTLTRLESLYFPDSNYIDPVLLLPRFAQNIGLTRQQVAKMISRVRMAPAPLDESSRFFNPATVAAFIIIDYCKFAGLPISAAKVQRHCGISKTALDRFKKREKCFPEETVVSD